MEILELMSKNIIFLNPSWEQKALVEEIDSLGINIIGLGKEAPEYSNLFKRYISCEVNDIDTIFDICKTNNINGVISDNCDYSLLSSELTCNLLDLPNLGIDAARTSNDKIMQRKLASLSKINQPSFQEVNNLLDALEFTKNMKKSVILKPTDSRGSIGITFIEKDSEKNIIGKAISFALTNSPSKRCIIEEYIEGQLITIDGFLVDGDLLPIAIAERERSSRGLTVTNSIKYYSNLHNWKKKKYFSFLEEVSKSLGYLNGHIHCEAIVDTERKIWLVECTNRGAGVFTSSIINPYISNHPINNFLIKLKLGEKPKIPKIDYENFEQNDASLIFPSLGNAGQILYSCNNKKIHSHSQVLAFQLFCKIGRPITAQQDGPSRHFAVALKTSDYDEINEIISYIKKDCFLIS